MNGLKKILCAYVCFSSINVLAEGFVEGIPVSLQKTDYSGKHLLFVKFANPVANSGCGNHGGVVIHDENESSKAALSFAMAALVSGKTFRCYVQDNQCSVISGNNTTYPVCAYYPTLVN